MCTYNRKTVTILGNCFGVIKRRKIHKTHMFAIEYIEAIFLDFSLGNERANPYSGIIDSNFEMVFKFKPTTGVCGVKWRSCCSLGCTNLWPAQTCSQSLSLPFAKWYFALTPSFSIHCYLKIINLSIRIYSCRFFLLLNRNQNRMLYFTLKCSYKQMVLESKHTKHCIILFDYY